MAFPLLSYLRQNQETLIVEKFARDQLCLEIGPGYGKFLIQDPSKRVGVDVDLQICKSLWAKNLNCIHASIENLADHNKESYDIVYCRNVIEHLQPSELASLLLQSEKLLRSGGKLILITPSIRCVWRTASHIRPYPPVSLFKLLNSDTENYIYNDKARPTRLSFESNYCTFKNKIKYLGFLFFLLFNFVFKLNSKPISDSPAYSSHYIIIIGKN